MVPVIHPPAGIANRCTKPVSIGTASPGGAECPLDLSGSPIAIMLPSLFTDTEFPNLALPNPLAAVSLAANEVAAHPVAGFVNTYTAPLKATLPSAASAATTTVLPSPLIITTSPNSSKLVASA